MFLELVKHSSIAKHVSQNPVAQLSPIRRLSGILLLARSLKTFKASYFPQCEKYAIIIYVIQFK